MQPSSFEWLARRNAQPAGNRLLAVLRPGPHGIGIRATVEEILAEKTMPAEVIKAFRETFGK